MAAMMDDRNKTISLFLEMKSIFMQIFSLFLASNMAAVRTLNSSHLVRLRPVTLSN